MVAEEKSRLFRVNALLFGECSTGVQLKVLRMVVRHLANLVMSLDDEIVRLVPVESDPVEECKDIVDLC